MASPTRADLEQITKRISDPAKAADFLSRFDKISAQIDATEDPIERATLATQLATLFSEANAAANASGGGGGRGGGFLTMEAFGLVVLIVLLSFAFLFWYFIKLGPARFSSIESTRPLLVLTLIISMLGFGGLLILRALFSPYDGDELQNRFRLAREIFLVFSGIFGTIIGFYFGSGDDNRANAVPTVEVSYAANQVLASISGGIKPFTGILTLKNAPTGTTVKSDKPSLSFQVGGTCPEGATVTVVDSGGHLAEAKLNCPKPAEGGNSATPVDQNATDNSTANSVTNDQNTQ